MQELSLKQVRELVKLARTAIEYYLEKKEALKTEGTLEKRGVFTTLHTFPDGNLRGCIGFPQPTEPLDKAVVESALNAAFNDQRFPPISKSELDKVTLEISVLTAPKQISFSKPEECIRKIKPGRDGLIMELGFCRGLLLPQVAADYGWNAEEFLEQACAKAGLSRQDWRDSAAKISSFHAQVFKEETPGGKVVQE